MSITLKSRDHEEPWFRLMLTTLPSRRCLCTPINGVPLTSPAAAPSSCSAEQQSGHLMLRDKPDLAAATAFSDAPGLASLMSLTLPWSELTSFDVEGHDMPEYLTVLEMLKPRVSHVV